MINLNELDTTSLITLYQEMSYTNKMLHNLDNMILYGINKEQCIEELSNQLDYYIMLQNEVFRKGYKLELGEDYGTLGKKPR